MKRKLTGLACLLLLTAGPLGAEESARGGLEDFTTPILRVPVAVVAAVTPVARPPEVADLAGLPASRPVPRLSLKPLLGTELSTGNSSVVYSSSPLMDRRLEALRSGWRAQDLVRLERQHREDTPWIHTLDRIFPEPQTFRVGNRQMTGGLVNAVQRRNPFCLLDPYFFLWSF
jgi:hypothetical protein